MSTLDSQLFPGLPFGWRTIPTRYISECLDGKRIPLNVDERASRKGDFPYWGANGVVDYVDDYLFDEKLVLVGEDGAPFFDKNKSVAFVVEEKIWVNNHIHVLKISSKHDARYIAYCLNVTDYGPWIEGSTRDKLTQDKLKSILIPCPIIDTQIAVSDFLDRETSCIDSLIAAKENHLILIAEKRRALITTIVTRGIDPTVQFKETGIPWLCDIPEHWPLFRAKFLWRECSIPVRNDDEMVTCFRDGQVTLRKNRREDGFTNAVKELGYQGVRVGQLVLHSMDAFAGAIGVSDSEGKCTPEYIVCDPVKEEVYNPYYGYLLRIMAINGFVQATCTAVRERAPRIHFSDFGNMFFPLPPLEEQRAIVDHIFSETAKLDALRVATEKTINLLKERRTALISAAVTGKIDLQSTDSKQEAHYAH